MTEPRWDEDRLRAAFADRFGRPAPDGLADLAIARTRGTPVRRRTVVPAWAGAVAAVLVVALGGGVLLWSRASAPEPSPSPPDATASPEPTGIDGFPSEVVGLQVISVSEAIALREAGPDDTELAVRGWMSNPPPISCPAPLQPPGPVELVCPDSIVSWLTERDEATWEVTSDGFRGRPATGPALQPIFDAAAPRGTTDGSGRTGLDPTPFPVVLVGHFDDHRSLLCPDVDSCRRNFVVDARVWIAGAPAGQEVVGLDPADGAARLQHDQAAALASAVGRATGDPWIALLGSSSIAGVDPRIAETRGLADATLIWVVRLLERDADGIRARTYFVDDSTGDVYRSTPARVILALGAGERVVDVGDGVRVRITDRTGTLTDARPLGQERRPEEARLVAGDGDPPAYLWLSDDQRTALAMEWVGSPCDRDWSLVIRNPSPWIELDHPEIGPCPSIPARRGIVLIFAAPITIEDVGVTVQSPYQPD